MADPVLSAQGAAVKDASLVLRGASSATKDAALHSAADALGERAGAILAANAHDVEAAHAAGMAPPAIDRLTLDDARLAQMAAGLRGVAALADPVGEVVDGSVRPNGLRVERVRVPLGVVGVIYENRPNVTSDAAGLCLKSGNAAFLRGSASAQTTNLEIVATLREGLAAAGLPKPAVSLVEDTSREAAVAFMQLRGVIDCLIPRGGRALLAAMAEHATVPYVVDGDGNCHVYVDALADLDMASDIVVNAKTSRPGVCNAAETLLVHRDVAERFLPEVALAMPQVLLRGDEATCALVARAVPASDEDYATEFLDLVLAVRVVDSIDAAIAHVARFGSGHSEAIVTRDVIAADRWVREVDAAAVLVNASTRFVDGAELGLGAEVGISTQKLHARGPMGLRELTCTRWVVRGEGQVR
ncbi:MAG TPA: glutamate-5-semialdehyde dehydrogenase [Acidimicrobiales bacterium]|jgi:glutamate-5-semialdehyde dehydrogenase|nr:glutamate-5-semialdehyde dehydrogenase [Acidimicrobiales bacterium]